MFIDRLCKIQTHHISHLQYGKFNTGTTHHYCDVECCLCLIKWATPIPSSDVEYVGSSSFIVQVRCSYTDSSSVGVYCEGIVTSGSVNTGNSRICDLVIGGLSISICSLLWKSSFTSSFSRTEYKSYMECDEVVVILCFRETDVVLLNTEHRR